MVGDPQTAPDDEDRKREAAELLRDLAHRVRRSGNVPFPPAFLRAEEGEDDPPLARLLRGGRGGEVRLKLYLSMTMTATSKPWDIRTLPTPSYWANLFLLPVGTGRRRVSDAMTWLRDNKLIELNNRTSATPRVVLLDPGGSGNPYVRPVEAGRYIGVPVGLWTRGWINELSAVGLTLLLVLLDQQGGYDTPRYVIRRRKESYRLSHDTWTRGRNELEECGLLYVTRVPLGSYTDEVKMRNAYYVDAMRLSERPRHTNDTATASQDCAAHTAAMMLTAECIAKPPAGALPDRPRHDVNERHLPYLTEALAHPCWEARRLLAMADNMIIDRRVGELGRRRGRTRKIDYSFNAESGQILTNL